MKTERSSTPAGSRTLIIILCALLIVSLAAIGFLLWKTIDLGKQRNELTAEVSVAAAANETLNAQLLEAQSAASTQPGADTALADLQAEFDAYKADSNAAYAALADEFTAYQTNAQDVLAAAYTALSDAYAQYKADAAQAAADAATAGDAALQAAQAEADAALNALQTEFDAYKSDAQTAQDALQAEFADYKASVELAQANAATQTEADTQAAQDAAAQALNDLQASFDAYKTDAETKYAALSDEFDAYKNNAESVLAAAINAGDTRVAAVQASADLSLSTLQSELDAYKQTAEANAAAAKTEADAAVAAVQQELDAYMQTAEANAAAAKTEADAALAAVQQELDAYMQTAEADAATAKTEADAALAAVQQELDAYKQTAEANAKTAKTESDAALAAVQQELDSYKQSASANAAAKTEADTALAAAQQTVADMQQTLADTEKSLALASIPVDENGAGNAANGMLALLYNGNIYYHNNYNHGNIYVENTAGMNDEYQSKTDSDPTYQVNNILGGYENYLYYRNNYRIYRVNLDTGHIDTIVKAFHMYPQSGMLAIGKTLYFLNSPYNGEGELRDNLWHMNAKGGNLQSVPGVQAGSLASDGQALYYTALDAPAIVRLDPADDSRQTLLSGTAECLNLSGGMLYFSLDGQLMKMAADGTGLASIGGAKGSTLNVIGDWVYYANSGDSDRLYRITTDGLYNEKLADIQNVRDISIAGGWVYFLEYERHSQWGDIADAYKIRLDGTDLALARP